MADPAPGDLLGETIGDTTADGRLAPLDQKTVEMRGTTFTFHKMMPIPAFRLLEKLRVGLGGSTLFTQPVDTPLQIIGVLLAAVDEVTFEEVRRRLYDRVTFTNSARPDGAKLLDDEEAAFAELGPEHLYEVVVRAFFTAFRPSFDEIRSWLPPQTMAAITQLIPSTSNPSSPTPSSPDGFPASG